MKDQILLPRDFGGVPGFVMDILIREGFDTIGKLRNASDEDLNAVEFMGPGRIALIRKALEVIDDYDKEGDAVKSGGYIWLNIWKWKRGRGGRAFLYANFAPGVEVRSMRFRNESGELSLLIWSHALVDEGKPELSYRDAQIEYPFLFKEKE